MQRHRSLSLIMFAFVLGSLLTPVATALAAPASGDTGQSVTPVGQAQVNMRELASQRSSSATGGPAQGVDPDPVYREPSGTGTSSAAPAVHDSAGPSIASPSALRTFEGVSDGVKIGTGFFTIPPDTNGAVGPNHVVTQLNNNISIRSKTDGTLSIPQVSLETFWAPSGSVGAFDPRTLYDPYNNRWLASAVSNAQSATSAVLVGISATSDPTGSWTLFRFDADAGNTNW